MQETEQQTPATRRSFFTALIYGIWGAITAAIAVPAGAYLLLPPSVRRGSDWIDVTDIGSIPPEVPTCLLYTSDAADE